MAAPASTFYLVKHIFKADKKASAAAWTAEMGKRMGEKHGSVMGGDFHIEKGVWNHFMLPTGPMEGEDIYCLWEAKAGMADEAMQEFLDSNDGPDFGINCMNNCMYKLMQAPFMNGQSPKFTDAGPNAEVGGANSCGPCGSQKFYIVEHHLKTKKHSDEWWGGMPKVMEGMAEMQARHKAAGFANAAFCATGGQGKIFCVWEVAEGKTVKDLQEVLDGPDVGRGALLNSPYLVNLAPGQNMCPVKSGL